jgi:putative transposase
MPRKQHKPEEIVAKLRQVDVWTSQGKSEADSIRAIGVTEVRYYRWRQEYGGLSSGQVKRMKDLEAENAHFERAIWKFWTLALAAWPELWLWPSSRQPGRHQDHPGRDGPRRNLLRHRRGLAPLTN